MRIVFKAARKKNKRNKEDIGNIISNVRRFGSGQRGEAILAERALLLNNSNMGAQIAIELSKLEGFVFPPLDYKNICTFFYRGGLSNVSLFFPTQRPWES